jgi:hypothetical protein
MKTIKTSQWSEPKYSTNEDGSVNQVSINTITNTTTYTAEEFSKLVAQQEAQLNALTVKVPVMQAVVQSSVEKMSTVKPVTVEQDVL